MSLKHHIPIFIPLLLAISPCFTMQMQESSQIRDIRLNGSADTLKSIISKIIRETNKIPKTADLCFLLNQTEETTNRSIYFIQPSQISKIISALVTDNALLLNQGEKNFNAVQEALKNPTTSPKPSENTLGYLAQQFVRIQKSEFPTLPLNAAYLFLASLAVHLNKASNELFSDNFLLNLCSLGCYLDENKNGQELRENLEWHLFQQYGKPENPDVKKFHMFFHMTTFFHEYTRTIIALATSKQICFSDDKVCEKLTEIRVHKWTEALNTKSFLLIITAASKINDTLILRNILYSLLFARTKNNVSLLKIAQEYPTLKRLLEEQLYEYESKALLE